jgi:hypothetical protein
MHIKSHFFWCSPPSTFQAPTPEPSKRGPAARRAGAGTAPRRAGPQRNPCRVDAAQAAAAPQTPNSFIILAEICSHCTQGHCSATARTSIASPVRLRTTWAQMPGPGPQLGDCPKLTLPRLPPQACASHLRPCTPPPFDPGSPELPALGICVGPLRAPGRSPSPPYSSLQAPNSSSLTHSLTRMHAWFLIWMEMGLGSVL